MRIATCVIVALFAGSAFAADDKPAVKEIALKDLKIKFPEKGKATEPTEITSADELAKNEALKGADDEIKKQVNFEKEKLLFFAWSGSGGDKIKPVESTAGYFIYSLGQTRDLRQHAQLFVVPKDAKVLVNTAKK